MADYEALRQQVLAPPQPGLPAPADESWLLRQGLAAWLRREAPKVTEATSALPAMAATILVPQRQPELVQALVNLALGRYPTLIL